MNLFDDQNTLLFSFLFCDQGLWELKRFSFVQYIGCPTQQKVKGIFNMSVYTLKAYKQSDTNPLSFKLHRICWGNINFVRCGVCLFSTMIAYFQLVPIAFHNIE